jgi:hypothetical protein
MPAQVGIFRPGAVDRAARDELVQQPIGDLWSRSKDNCKKDSNQAAGKLRQAPQIEPRAERRTNGRRITSSNRLEE